jgi:hypothetical protein
MVITVLTTIIHASAEMKRAGQESDPAPKKPTPNGPHSGEGKSQGPEILE